MAQMYINRMKKFFTHNQLFKVNFINATPKIITQSERLGNNLNKKRLLQDIRLLYHLQLALETVCTPGLKYV